MGLTSKQHLFMRVILVVTLANAAIFYSIFRNLQALTVTWRFTEVAVLATAVTLFALTVNLEFWWRYQRRTDNVRFWGNVRFWRKPRDLELG
jgi:hypothetical protein